MMRSVRKFLRKVQKDESGGVFVVEFVILLPLIMLIFLTSFEIGFRSYRHLFLDRALDMTVRDIRLGTGSNFQHDDIKISICNYAGFLVDCDNDLKLEMNGVDIRGWSGSLGDPDCIDRAQPGKPIRNFENGVQHELMILRACYLYNPIFPLFGLGSSYQTSGEYGGLIPLISTDGFVQEP